MREFVSHGHIMKIKQDRTMYYEIHHLKGRPCSELNPGQVYNVSVKPITCSGERSLLPASCKCDAVLSCDCFCHLTTRHLLQTLIY